MRLSTTDLPLFFTDRHRELADALIAMREPIENREANAGGARGVAEEMAELGLYQWLLPPSGTVSVRALCLIREFLGYISPLADAIFAVHGLGSYPLVLAGDDGRLARCRSGELIAGFALTEPEAGSDVASMKTTAKKAGHGRGYVLEGEKTLISNVGIADYYVVFATVDPGAARAGITAFIVTAGAPGLSERPIELGVDHPIGELSMHGCEAEILGEVGAGFELAMRTLDTFRVSVGAAAVGMARRALDATLARVRERVQFDKPLAAQPVVQSMMADMATDLDASRLLVLRAAHDKDQGKERVTTEAAMAKLFATEAAQRIIDRAVQLHGGRGVVSGEVVENLYRAIRPLRIYEGTSEIQRLIIGRSLVRS